MAGRRREPPSSSASFCHVRLRRPHVGDIHRLVDRGKCGGLFAGNKKGEISARREGARRGAGGTGSLLQSAGSGYLGSRSRCGSFVKCPDETPAPTRLPHGAQRHLGKGGAAWPGMTSTGEPELCLLRMRFAFTVLADRSSWLGMFPVFAAQVRPGMNWHSALVFFLQPSSLCQLP